MPLALIVLAVLSALEAALYIRYIWPAKKVLASCLIVSLSIVSGVILVDYFSAWAILLTIFTIYRMINLLRLVEARIHDDYLFFGFRRASLCLISCQIITLLAAAGVRHWQIEPLTCFYVLAGGQLLAGLVIFSSTRRQLQKTQPPALARPYTDQELPALTVAIPARNETADLKECLESLVASSYPKLEILVLDDCSQNKHTPQIIRDFAQAGVHFISGKLPPDTWLAKNYAYQQLTDAASGELVLFCGVDCRFQPDSLKTIVSLMLQKKKTMISLLPKNRLLNRWNLHALLVQPARYAWELALPRRWLQRPAVLSTCWLITAEELQTAGGLEAVSRKCVPESYFARQIAKKDGYSFMQSGAEIGLESAKNFEEQLSTSVRTRYPQLHRRPELVALTSLAEFTVLIWPMIILGVTIATQIWALAILSGLACMLNCLAYSRLVNLTYRRFVFNGLWILPVAALVDLGLLNYSMWQYEFREVIWKGRNICLPVMQALPALPKLKN